jgi:hypothetical protein
VDILRLRAGYLIFPPRTFWCIPNLKRRGQGAGRAGQQDCGNREMTKPLLIIHMHHKRIRFLSF